jgi:hypothetical protein
MENRWYYTILLTSVIFFFSMPIGFAGVPKGVAQVAVNSQALLMARQITPAQCKKDIYQSCLNSKQGEGACRKLGKQFCKPVKLKQPLICKHKAYGQCFKKLYASLGRKLRGKTCYQKAMAVGASQDGKVSSTLCKATCLSVMARCKGYIPVITLYTCKHVCKVAGNAAYKKCMAGCSKNGTCNSADLHCSLMHRAN